LDGVSYWQWNGSSIDLSQVTLWGQQPVAWSNEASTVSYLVQMTGGQEYTLDQDSFTWPHGEPSPVATTEGSTIVAYPTVHELNFSGFHNAKLEIVGPDKLVSTTDAAGLPVILTASNYPSGGTFQWSTTSTNLQLQGSTTGSSVVVAPIQGNFTPKGGNEIVTLIYTYSGGSITNTFKIVVQKPTSLGMQLGDNVLQGNTVSLKVRYQILDQNAQPLRPVVRVGNANVRIVNLKASEVLAWQCGTYCSQAQPDSRNVGVRDDGTFDETLSASTTCSGFVRSQGIYVGILDYDRQDNVAYKCICFDGSEFKDLQGSANGAACCDTCGP
jgi:hypothetical protein